MHIVVQYFRVVSGGVFPELPGNIGTQRGRPRGSHGEGVECCPASWLGEFRLAGGHSATSAELCTRRSGHMPSLSRCPPLFFPCFPHCLSSFFVLPVLPLCPVSLSFFTTIPPRLNYRSCENTRLKNVSEFYSFKD